VDVGDLRIQQTERGTYCCAVRRELGRPTAEVLPGILAEAACAISFPKSMRWHHGGRRFARPVRNVLALLDDKVLPVEVFGLRAGRDSRGHVFLAPGPVRMDRADYVEYCARLKEACVRADMAERERVIREMLEGRLAQQVGPGAKLSEDDLLREVVMLVEWPSLVEGTFDASFLAVPAPVLEAAMMEHQRYFPVKDAQGNLRPCFLDIADRPDDASGYIRKGNERVLQARLADARYFWETDARRTLAARVEQLSQIQFLAGLGTYRDKVGRLVRLVGWLAGRAAAAPQAQVHAERAALLCKSDLLTEMVGEFPSLQGTVGSLYARREGEGEAVAQAIGEHYQPKGAADELPRSEAGRLVALAEKMDNLAGGFVLGLAPTGSQDPYALRRQAQAVIRLAESVPGLRLDDLSRRAIELIPPSREGREQACDALLGFLKERLYQLCLDRGAPHDLARAAMASGWEDAADLADRLRVLQRLCRRPEWPALVTVVERTYNIGKDAPAGEVDESALTEKEEKELWRLYQRHEAEIRQLIGRRDYLSACLRFAEAFAEPVHVFFDRVFVNVEDARLRANRLALVKKINVLFSERIADLSQIVTGVEK
jgi:glycyl-tRNA synthetase beta chain